MRIFVVLCFAITAIYSKNNFRYYSQKGQDKWLVEKIFKEKQNGYFVDLAAANGKYLSNTYTLEKQLHWHGICIEPNPLFLDKLIKNRSCIIDTSCIDFTQHEIEFRIDNKELGGIIDDDVDNNLLHRSKEIEKSRLKNKTILLTTKTLEQILDQYQAPKVIDYLSLDVEGAETRILKDFPFDKCIFLAMTIERPSKELNEILFKNGYVFVKNFRCDTFYVHKSIENLDQIKKKTFTQLPMKDW